MHEVLNKTSRIISPNSTLMIDGCKHFVNLHESNHLYFVLYNTTLALEFDVKIRLPTSKNKYVILHKYVLIDEKRSQRSLINIICCSAAARWG